MIIDRQTTLFDKASPTAVSTVASDSYDTGATPANLGRGRPIRAKVTTDAAFTTSASGTLKVDYIQSANSDLSSPDILYTTGVLAVAALAIGVSVMDIQVPDNTKRYVGFQTSIATGVMTAGTLSASLVLETQSPALYPAATNL